MNKQSIQDKTLDICHKEHMVIISENKTVKIPELISLKESLKEKYSKSVSIDEKLQIKDRIQEIREKIKKMKKFEKDYLLNNSKFVYNYFEQKKEISNGNNNITVIDQFFNNDKPSSIDKEKEKNISKQYFQSLTQNSFAINDYVKEKDICNVCNKGELIPLVNDGLLICNVCSNQFSNLIECEKPSYKEPPKEVCFYAYKRINHFREIIAQFQAKETTQISDEIIEKIRQQIIKERISIENLTNKHAKDILKRLNLNKYYEHIPFIKDKLGIKPPVMSQELETTLCNLFIEIQAPYAKFCPEGRVNFLNYYYTIYKLCELLNEREFLPYFPMLKDRDKRVEQDEIWKKICQELDWEFIPTL